MIDFLDGEEAFAPRMSETDGLYGSRHDVARRGSQLPVWQINLDMVGGRNKKKDGKSKGLFTKLFKR